MVVMVHWLICPAPISREPSSIGAGFPLRSKLICPAPISRELSSIGAGSALRYEILNAHDW